MSHICLLVNSVFSWLLCGSHGDNVTPQPEGGIVAAAKPLHNLRFVLSCIPF